MIHYLAGFDESAEDITANAHPADVVPYLLAAGTEEDKNMRVRHIEDWFRQYAAKRSNHAIFKGCSEFAAASELVH